MAYNKKNLLKRVIEIQNIVLEYRNSGVSQRWVYENVIRERYLIGLSTFNKYLARNAKSELKK